MMKNSPVTLLRCQPSSVEPLVFHQLLFLQLLHYPDIHLCCNQLPPPSVRNKFLMVLRPHVFFLSAFQAQSQCSSLIPDPLLKGVLSSCRQVHWCRSVIATGVVCWSDSWRLLARCCWCYSWLHALRVLCLGFWLRS